MAAYYKVFTALTVSVIALTVTACGGSTQSENAGTINHSESPSSSAQVSTSAAPTEASLEETQGSDATETASSETSEPVQKNIISSESDRQELIRMLTNHFNGPIGYTRVNQLKKDLAPYNVSIADGSVQAFYEPTKAGTYVSHIMAGDMGELSQFGTDVTIDLFVGASREDEAEAVKRMNQYLETASDVVPNQTLTISLKPVNENHFEIVAQRVSAEE